MNAIDLYNQGMAAYEAEQYEEAMPYFQRAAEAGMGEAEVFIALCYFSLATDISLAASASNVTETLVRGQQKAVKLTDTTIRTCLNFLRRHIDDVENSDAAAALITHSFGLQYALVATGLTTAYHITHTTKTIERTSLNGLTLWEDIVGVETNEFVSLYSYDFSEYHLFGPDERTKRIEAAKAIIQKNTVDVATILELLGRERDALMLRAEVACEMADCENGDRSMLLAAEWFIDRAMEVGYASLVNGEDTSVYDSWYSGYEQTVADYHELTVKYNALLNNMKRHNTPIQLGKFYQSPEETPQVTDSQLYVSIQNEAAQQNQTASRGNGFQVFLSIFAQAANQKVIPMVVFASAVSLFGGLFALFDPNASFMKVFVVVFFVIAMLMTFIRSVKDADNITGKENFRLFMLIRFGITLIFSINFWVALVVFFLLKFLSKPYR